MWNRPVVRGKMNSATSTWSPSIRPYRHVKRANSDLTLMVQEVVVNDLYMILVKAEKMKPFWNKTHNMAFGQDDILGEAKTRVLCQKSAAICISRIST